MGRRAELVVDGKVIDLDVRRSQRARRILLKIDPRLGAQLIIPRGVPREEALSFANEKSEWLRDRLAGLPAPIPFCDGAIVPILGCPHRIRHTSATDLFHTRVRCESGELLTDCEQDDSADKIRAWFRENAREALSVRARTAAGRIGAEVSRITIRDPRTRWGSCSSTGALSFSWRLFMAPEWVLDYVVAHEVAHLIEMNHGRSFWRLVNGLVGRIDEAKSWLRRSGPRLHRYG
ncbi:MAG: hypothetical protein CL569_14630 [Alphaproteobacteria bacterium]|nr:hypothetical protein [Alphaproteobacteria bacterium]|tara:strand:+ start:4731 stop:5432 length:702 start_codon:yes stop_codon:yes gene_type:complete